MSDMTPEQLEAAAKQTAALYNAQNPVGETEEEAQARAAAAELNNMQGNIDHDGQGSVVADDPEALAAKEAAKAAADAEAAEAAKTPEEKAAEEAAAKEASDKAKADAAADTSGEWITNDSKEFNAAQSLMKAAGMTPAEAALVFDGAMDTGDMTKIDMDLLVEKVGEDKANLIVAGFGRYVETEGQAILERTAKVHEVVGGTGNWSKMVAWARTKAKGDEAFAGKVQDITAMMNGNSGFQAELAAKEFLSMFNADGGNSTITPTAKTIDVHAKQTSPATPAVTPMSARMYAEGVETANRTLRGAELNAAVASLRAARAAGRAQGL